jgi:hypothetical protein
MLQRYKVSVDSSKELSGALSERILGGQVDSCGALRGDTSVRSTDDLSPSSGRTRLLRGNTTKGKGQLLIEPAAGKIRSKAELAAY